MQSSFSRSGGRITSSSARSVDEVYNLLGLDMVHPDQVMADTETPYTINARLYARQDGESRVAIRTRKGSDYFSVPIGETANVQNVDTSTGEVAFSTTTWVAQPFTPNASNSLTKIELHIRKQTGATGHVRVEICSDDSGEPGGVLAESSLEQSPITTSFTYQPAYFMDAPSLVSGTQYWIRVFVQDNGTGSYELNRTATSGALQTIDEGATYTALNDSFRYKTYLSTTGKVKGMFRRYAQNGNDITLMAHKNDIYTVNDTTGVTASIDSTISSNSTRVRFTHIDDKTYWIDGQSTSARVYDGSTVSNLSNSPAQPKLLLAYQQRLFFVPDGDPTRVEFSELNEFTNYPAVNFFYVPSPKSPDHITALVKYSDTMLIFTHESKHIVYGSDIASFSRREAVGTKGALSQEATAVDRNSVYFMADDKMIYRFNGVTDQPMSEKMEPEFSAISDPSSVSLHLYDNQLRVYYQKSNETNVTRMAIFDTIRKQWFMDTGRAVGESLEWTQDENQLIEASSKVGALYFGEQTEADLGKPIDFKYWTRYKAYSSGSAKDRIRKFHPYIRAGDSPYTMQIGRDINFQNDPQMRSYVVRSTGAVYGTEHLYGDGTVYGSVTFVDRKTPMSGRGKHTQYRFERKGVHTPVELYGYLAEIMSGRVQ